MASILSFDPAAKLGSASQGITKLPVIIGLPSAVNPVPNFVIGVTTTEKADTDNQITGLPITDGDLVLKSARNPGNYNFQFILSETPNVSKQQVAQISKIVQTIANVANTVYGTRSLSNLTGLAGLSAGWVTTQIKTLQNMKDGFQPIFALNLYMPLGALSIGGGFMQSSWFIQSLHYDKAEAERGVVINISLRELLSKNNPGSASGIIQNLANQLLGPAVGSTVGKFL